MATLVIKVHTLFSVPTAFSQSKWRNLAFLILLWPQYEGDEVSGDTKKHFFKVEGVIKGPVCRM